MLPGGSEMPPSDDHDTTRQKESLKKGKKKGKKKKEGKGKRKKQKNKAECPERLGSAIRLP